MIIVGYELKQLPVFFASSLNFFFRAAAGTGKNEPPRIRLSSRSFHIRARGARHIREKI
jgi:hypothetical protein